METKQDSNIPDTDPANKADDDDVSIEVVDVTEKINENVIDLPSNKHEGNAAKHHGRELGTNESVKSGSYFKEWI